MKTMEISEIDEMLLKLSEERVKEVRDFIGYLLDMEKKHQAFVERVLKSKQETSVEFESADILMKAIREFEE
jgi:hypothetical protein